MDGARRESAMGDDARFIFNSRDDALRRERLLRHDAQRLLPNGSFRTSSPLVVSLGRDGFRLRLRRDGGLPLDAYRRRSHLERSPHASQIIPSLSQFSGNASTLRTYRFPSLTVADMR